MPVESYDPETDRPQNGTHEQIKNIYDQLTEAGYGEAAALRVESRGTSEKAHMAKKLRNHLLTPDTLPQKAEKALEENDSLTDDQEKDVRDMLSRANTLESANEEYAEELRQQAVALAEYGEPQSHAATLDESGRETVSELLARSNTMRGIDPEHSATLREQAVEELEDTVKAERGDIGEVAINRDIEATIDNLESQL